MCGKKLVNNLTEYVSSLSSIDIPVFKFDLNQELELPCVIVGYSKENNSIQGGYGHYTVQGFVMVCTQGYEDETNTIADSYTESIVDSLINKPTLHAYMNAPLSGTDTRPSSAFCLNGLFLRSVERENEGTSTVVTINFDAYTAAKDGQS
jgi:hypothetical protein